MHKRRIMKIFYFLIRDKGFSSKFFISLSLVVGLVWTAGCFSKQNQEAVRREEQLDSLSKIVGAIRSYEKRIGRIDERQKGKNIGRLSWRVLILEDLGFGDVAKTFRLDKDWDARENRAGLDKRPPLYRCGSLPSLSDVIDHKITNYVMFFDLDGNRYVGDAGLTYIVWTRPDNLESMDFLGSPCHPGCYISRNIDTDKVVYWSPNGTKLDVGLSP